MDYISKKPYEKFPIDINFSSDLDTGEAVSSYTLACIDEATGEDSSADIVSSDLLSDPRVVIILKGGNTGEQHKITVRALTDFDNVFEKDIAVVIKEATANTFLKQSNEEFVFECDFTEELEDGDSINGRTVAAVKLSDSSDATSAVIKGSLLSSPKLNVGVMGGTDGEIYNISIKADTVNGYKYQNDVLMAVRDR